LSIFRAISVQLANRDERAPGAIVIVSAALGHDVDIYGTRDRLVRAARLVLVDHRRPLAVVAHPRHQP
jgi:hypothetical protein